jgi:hypothetical protein
VPHTVGGLTPRVTQSHRWTVLQAVDALNAYTVLLMWSCIGCVAPARGTQVKPWPCNSLLPETQQRSINY